MLIFFRPETDPYLNIAAEEYFVKHANEDMCMIWINEQSVIIGKHQNAYAEINYPFVSKNNIPVIRRISGGGAVYHDSGNLNFTFIKKTDKSNPVDFGQFTSIIIKFIQSFGIEVNVSKRNSLFIGSQKFSGHAEHIFHDRILHHGTLLFNTDLISLQLSLNPEKEFQGKAMTSVRNDVVNIAPLLPDCFEIHQFADRYISWLLEYYPESKAYKIQADELLEINHLAETKYKTWKWNFGYSPAYSFNVNVPVNLESVPITVKVENGQFVQIDLNTEFMDRKLFDILSSMQDLLHNEEEINKFVINNRIALELAGVNTVYFTEAFFK